MKTLKKIFITMLILSISVSVSFAYTGVTKSKKLDDLFGDANVKYYDGSAGIGINHIAYWTMSAEEVVALAPEEQAKVAKIRANGISSSLYPPEEYDVIPGWEVTGTLVGGKKKNPRVQTISLVIPDDWNGKLIVLGTPGTRSEYGEASLMSPWLLDRGYATIEGDKGMPNGNADLLNGNHVTQFFGVMMLDLAEAAQKTIKKATGMKPLKTYAAGMSNGGIQTRLALELDHAKVNKGKGKRLGKKKHRLFDGGLAWSGSYYPRKEILDTDGNGKVTVEEYVEHADITLFGSINKSTMLMGWAHGEDSITNPENFNAEPPFPTVYDGMIANGLHPDSARIWGAYNSNFDFYKYYPGYSIFAGIGYFNFSAAYYLAEARGDDATEANAYTAYNLSGDPDNPIEPPLYAFLEDNADTLGFTKEAVKYFLKIANSAEFSVPLIEIHGTKDSLVPTNGQGMAYQEAVEEFGNPELHRLYLIENGMHVEYQVDFGRVDFDFDGNPEDLAVEGEVVKTLTPMQGYAMLAMDKLEDWVENGIVPVESQTVLTDPVNDEVLPF